jgi:sugar (pentulose or hexulose) kinase
MVTTPTGKPVAMVHSNNCTSDLNAWIDLFQEVTGALGVAVSEAQLYETLYKLALRAMPTAAGCWPTTTCRASTSHTWRKAARSLCAPPTAASPGQLHAHASLLLGRRVAHRAGHPLRAEQVQIDQILGHGGFFKTPEVGQRIMAAAMNVPVSVMETAGEGGAWGIALLAAYLLNKTANEPLEAYLADKGLCRPECAHAGARKRVMSTGFAAFMARYQQGLGIERAACGAGGCACRIPVCAWSARRVGCSCIGLSPTHVAKASGCPALHPWRRVYHRRRANVSRRMYSLCA